MIKPNKLGYYKCPYCPPPTNGYPARKWKTEKGILKHLSECNYTPEKMLLKKEKEENDKVRFELLTKEALLLSGLSVGDQIWYVHEKVVKPEYEWRGNRRVRVRYEAVVNYKALSCKIKSIDFYFSPLASCAEYVLYNCMEINSFIRFRSICLDEISAKERANKLQENHDAHLKFASECR